MIKQFLIKYLIVLFIIFPINILYSEHQIFNIQSLNSSSDEFAPVFNPNERCLYYNRSFISHTKLYKTFLEYDFGNKVSKEFIDSIFSKKSIEVTDNITQHNINPTYFSFNGNEAYLTGKTISDKGSLLGIYKINFEKNNWQLTRQIKELGKEMFTFHPTISPNGNVMVYCTAKVDNPEDSDLMIAFKDEQNNWTTSLPLNILNTNHSEITPFLASDDTLYFASNGFDGKGGFDIYYSIFENGQWQKPLPVENINTEYDESDFVKINDNFYLFASNRPGGEGGIDIWGYLLNDFDLFNEEPSVKISLNTSILKILQQSSYIQLIKNSTINEANIIKRYTNDSEYYYVFDDSLISYPTHLEIICSVNILPENKNYQLNIANNDKIVFSKIMEKKQEVILLPVDGLINPNDIPEKAEIKASFILNDTKKDIISKIEIIKSQKESPKCFEIDNTKYKLLIAPLSDEISNTELDKIFNHIKKVVKYKNGKIIIESSPTFEIYDIEKIRSYINSININNNVIIYQKKTIVNLSKYFYNLNFNYLLIYIQI